VNYAETLLRHEKPWPAPTRSCFIICPKLGHYETMTWHTLGSQVRILATQLRAWV